MEPRPNKTIVTEFYKNVVKLRKSELINDYVHENYIQHSPVGKDGREGLVEAVAFLKTLPQPEDNAPSPIMNIIAEGDYVAAHLDLNFMGKHVVLMELFRVQGGMAAERWDVTEEPSEQNTPIINTESVCNDTGLSNKAFITSLYQDQNIIIHHIISEDEFVAVHSELKTEAKSIALFDVFKMEGKLIAEHHYVKQEVPEKMMHSNGMF